MRKQVLIFGLVGGVLVTLLQWTEFRFVVVEHSVAIYGVLTAILFAGAGIWLGTRLLVPRERIVEVAVPAPKVTADDAVRERLGITRRELEIEAQRSGEICGFSCGYSLSLFQPCLTNPPDKQLRPGALRSHRRTWAENEIFRMLSLTEAKAVDVKCG